MQDNMSNEERRDSLEDIQNRLREIVEEIQNIVRGTDQESLSEAYLTVQLEMAIDDDHSWIGGNQCTIQSLIEAFNDVCECGECDGTGYIDSDEGELECQECGGVGKLDC